MTYEEQPPESAHPIKIRDIVECVVRTMDPSETQELVRHGLAQHRESYGPLFRWWPEQCSHADYRGLLRSFLLDGIASLRIG